MRNTLIFITVWLCLFQAPSGITQQGCFAAPPPRAVPDCCGASADAHAPMDMARDDDCCRPPGGGAQPPCRCHIRPSDEPAAARAALPALPVPFQLHQAPLGSQTAHCPQAHPAGAPSRPGAGPPPHIAAIRLII